nr:hypothetical protein [uncultured Mucilaginibacter sp.]
MISSTALGIAADTGHAPKALQAYERIARPEGNAIIYHIIVR